MAEFNLDNVPFEELEEAYWRRRRQKIQEHKKEIASRHNCRNCAYRIYARTWQGGLQGHETWVCQMRPKMNKSYHSTMPIYARSYRSCSNLTTLDCEMFVHRESEKGKQIVRKNQTMAERLSDFE